MNSVAQQPVETTNQPVFNWNSPLTINGKEEPADCLDRAKYAEFLTNYLSGFTDKSYVMNLNAEWGAGKTYFLKRWKETIKDTYPTAYIDAWKHDFDNEPLLTVISGITKTLEEACPNVGASQKQEAVYKSGKYLLSSVTDAVSVSGFGVNFDLGKAKSTFSQKRSDNELKVKLRLHNKKIDQIKEFRDKLQEWLEEVISYGKLKIPMFVFIDELDRCRPTYAIDMLEVIKHLFDIEGLVFVVATNTDQLQHSIKAVYGEGFDADTYLRRFFRRTYTLNKPDVESYIRTHQVYINQLSSSLLVNEAQIFNIQREELVKILAAIALNFKFDLRTTDQWLEQISVCYPVESSQPHKTFWLMTAFLLAIYLKPFFAKNIQDIKEYPSLPSANDRRKFLERFLDKDVGTQFILSVSPRHYHGGYHTLSDRTRVYEFTEKSEFEINLGYFDYVQICCNYIANKNNMNRDSLINGADQKQEQAGIPIIMDYYHSQYGTTLDTYLNLVKMATNLQ